MISASDAPDRAWRKLVDKYRNRLCRTSLPLEFWRGGFQVSAALLIAVLTVVVLTASGAQSTNPVAHAEEPTTEELLNAARLPGPAVAYDIDAIEAIAADPASNLRAVTSNIATGERSASSGAVPSPLIGKSSQYYTVSVAMSFTWWYWGDTFVCGYMVAWAWTAPPSQSIWEDGDLYVNGAYRDSTASGGTHSTSDETGCHGDSGSGSAWSGNAAASAFWVGEGFAFASTSLIDFRP